MCWRDVDIAAGTVSTIFEPCWATRSISISLNPIRLSDLRKSSSQIVLPLFHHLHPGPKPRPYSRYEQEKIWKTIDPLHRLLRIKKDTPQSLRSLSYLPSARSSLPISPLPHSYIINSILRVNTAHQGLLTPPMHPEVYGSMAEEVGKKVVQKSRIMMTPP